MQTRRTPNPPGPRTSTSGPRKPCHNCRAARKFNCDKTIPHCLACKERGQSCLGYGIRLFWPRENDARRHVRGNSHYLIPLQSTQRGVSGFIITASEDVEVFRKLDRLVTISRPFGSLIDPTRHISHPNPMARDQLHGLLIRMALYDEEAESFAIRHSLTALSYHHKKEERQAVIYQTRAIQALKQGLDFGAMDQPRAMQTFAASMLLSCFENTTFQSSGILPLKWVVFFGGAKSIAAGLAVEGDTVLGDRAILLDWLFYFDSVFKFSVRHWDDKEGQFNALAARRRVISKPAYSSERQVILPMLGCSQELLVLLCQVVDAVLDRQDPVYGSEDHLKMIRSLEIRLETLEQQYRGPSDVTPERVDQDMLTAELYRLALLLYLYRVVQGDSKDSPKVADVLGKALEILARIQYMERSWPLFVIGLEAHTDAQRATVLSVLAESLPRQKLGTMGAVDRMINSAWVLQDLKADGLDPLDTYRRVMGLNHAPLCFI